MKAFSTVALIMLAAGSLSGCTMGDDASITSVPKYGTVQDGYATKVVVDKKTCVEYFSTAVRQGGAPVSLTLRVDSDGRPVVNSACKNRGGDQG